MCLYFVSMNGVARSEEVVTKPTLHVSCCISILCITLTKDAMLEIAQVLDVHEVLGNCFLDIVNCHPEHLVLVGLFPSLVVHGCIVYLTIRDNLVSAFTSQNETPLQASVVIDVRV